ncbi:MAG: divergent polysaccharide deacetylase family protein [Candidatus Nitrospinota bacterium M3_3B_026]
MKGSRTGREGAGRGRGSGPFSFLSKYGFEIILGVALFALAAGVWLLLPGDEARQEDQHIESEVDEVRRPEMIVEEKLAAIPPEKGVETPPLPAFPEKPRIAFIIDDLGAEPEAAERLMAIDAPLALSILPGQRFSKSIAENAAKRGVVVMAHLPMQPKSSETDPGPGALTVSQDADMILRTLKADMDAVPGALGVNNHMGSLFTEDRERMSIVMREIKRRGLFFIDSRTTAGTVAYDVAVEYGARAASRDVFLDNERDVDKISGQIIALAEEALEKGSAIGIGHPYPETIEALERTIPVARAMGVEISPVTELLGLGEQAGAAVSAR